MTCRLQTFTRFLRLCAVRAGRLLNLSSLGSDAGVTHTTARRWISVLEASYVIELLAPHHESFSKRLVKSPKLYFVDTGLLCQLLGIRKQEGPPQKATKGVTFGRHRIQRILGVRRVQMKTTHVFEVVVEQDDDGRWSACCPVLEGCATWGKSEQEATHNIREAVELYVEDLVDAGEAVPVGMEVIQVSAVSVVTG